MSSRCGRSKASHMSLLLTFIAYFGYALLVLVGHLRDLMGSIFRRSRYVTASKEGYAPLLQSWESFFTKRIYHRIQDCWNRPIASNPGTHILVHQRTTSDSNKTLQSTGATISAINVGSYNYLGFADDWQKVCQEEVFRTLRNCPVSSSSAREDLGTLQVHEELDQTVARFLNKEAAMVFTMGYGTNLTCLPALVTGKDSLIISDSLNHMSLINGARASGAHIRVFNHDDIVNLEEVLRESISLGQPRTRRPWKKIIVVVEGIYSMEGEICNLKRIVEVCKRNKAYLYVDEAHSIGAIGKTGRGVCEYGGVDTRDVDVLMGTFSKSFGGMGGYVAANRNVIEAIRGKCAGTIYHNAMSPVVCQQILTAFKVIMGEDGTSIGAEKIWRLNQNANYFRNKLIAMGLHVYGDFDSPVIPVMLYEVSKVAAFSRECLSRGLAVVVVGFPATSLILSRARFCMSAAHTKQDLDVALAIISEVASKIRVRYACY